MVALPSSGQAFPQHVWLADRQAGRQAGYNVQCLSYDYFLLRISEERRLCLGTELTCDFFFFLGFFLDLSFLLLGCAIIF